MINTSLSKFKIIFVLTYYDTWNNNSLSSRMTFFYLIFCKLSAIVRTYWEKKSVLNQTLSSTSLQLTIFSIRTNNPCPRFL